MASPPPIPEQPSLRISNIDRIFRPYDYSLTDSNSYTRVFLDNTTPEFTNIINNFK